MGPSSIDTSVTSKLCAVAKVVVWYLSNHIKLMRRSDAPINATYVLIVRTKDKTLNRLFIEKLTSL